MKDKYLIFIIYLLCVFWCIFDLYSITNNCQYKAIIGLVINILGIVFINNFHKENSKKSHILMSLYFFIYGVISIAYNSYIVFSSSNINVIDNFYYISDITMIYFSIKINYKKIYARIQGFINVFK